jgi:hypothetical protein
MSTHAGEMAPFGVLRALFWLGLALALTGLVWLFVPTPGVDASYAPRLKHPHFRRGPVVLIDEAHGNTHTLRGLYRPLSRLLAAAGYRVGRNRQDFIAPALETTTVLIVANPDALARSEIEALRQWVRDGGGLFLIADHIADHVRATGPLARSFGIEITAKLTSSALSPEPSGILHPIRAGRQEYDESVQQLSLIPGPVINTIDPAASEVIPSRAAASTYGRGRAVVFTGADAFASRIAIADNDQLALNIILWLCKRL